MRMALGCSSLQRLVGNNNVNRKIRSYYCSINIHKKRMLSIEIVRRRDLFYYETPRSFVVIMAGKSLPSSWMMGAARDFVQKMNINMADLVKIHGKSRFSNRTIYFLTFNF